MQVIRPADPKLALGLAAAAVANQDVDLFERLPQRVDPDGGHYTFVATSRDASRSPCASSTPTDTSSASFSRETASYPD